MARVWSPAASDEVPVGAPAALPANPPRAGLIARWRNRRREGELMPLAKFSGPMPWVIAIMVALTVLASAAGLALSNVAVQASAELAGGMTVQVIEAGPEARERQAAAAVRYLAGQQDLVAVRRVPQAEVERLIAPWLGSSEKGGESVSSVPIPALVDARALGGLGPERLEALSRGLAAVAPSARIDAQAGWLGPVFAAIDSLRWLALALVVLLTGALAAAVLLAVRNALAAHRTTIEIVHMLGGTDVQIARIFQRAIGIDAAAGGLLGLAAAGAALVLVSRRLADLGTGLAAGGALGWRDAILLVLVPVAGTALAMLTARISVMRALRARL